MESLVRQRGLFASIGQLLNRLPNSRNKEALQSSMSLTLSFCFTGKRFVRVDPARSASLSMGPLMKPFSTSFMVAANRLRSVSLSPEHCTDSKRTSGLRFETFLGSSQVILAGRNFRLKTPDLGSQVKTFLDVVD